LIYAFVGFEAAVIPAGETKDPQKNVPFALLTALVFCVGLLSLFKSSLSELCPDWLIPKRLWLTPPEIFWAASARLLSPSARSSRFWEI
jgi:amino acid transporter